MALVLALNQADNASVDLVEVFCRTLVTVSAEQTLKDKDLPQYVS